MSKLIRYIEFPDGQIYTLKDVDIVTTGNYGSGEIMATGTDPNWGIDPKVEAERLEKELAAQRRAEEIFTNPEGTLEKIKIGNKYVNVYSLGRGPLSDSDLQYLDKYNLDWLVYHYNDEPYEGSGYAVGKTKKKDSVWLWDLGHCSCNGPIDEIEKGPPTMYTTETWKVNVVENALSPQLETVMSTLVNKLLGL